VVAADDVGQGQRGQDRQDGRAHEMEPDERPHAVVDPDRIQPRVRRGVARDRHGQQDRVPGPHHAQDALLGGAGAARGGADVLDRRAPLPQALMAVLDELVEARLLDPAQVGIIDARRAAEEVPQPLLVTRNEERNVAGDGMDRHRRGLRTPTGAAPPGGRRAHGERPRAWPARSGPLRAP